MSDIAARLRESFRWTGEDISDPSRWWSDGETLRELGPALAELFADDGVSVVAGIEARGFVLGPLVAASLGVGFVEVRKDEHPSEIGEQLLRRTTPPDFQGRSLTMTIRRSALGPGDRVLLVDDWIETGAQAIAARDLVHDAEAQWLGVAVIVDAVPSGTRRDLDVRALLREASLPWYR